MAFVNLQRWLELNEPGAEQMGADVADATGTAVRNANVAVGRLSGNAYSEANDAAAQEAMARAQSKLTVAGSMGGRAAVLAEKYAQQGRYDAGMGALDAFLSGHSQAVEGVQQAGRGLEERYKQAAEQSHQRAYQQQRQMRELQQRQQDERNAAARREEDQRLRDAYDAQKEWRLRNGVPNGPEEYAEYSDRVQRRGKGYSRSEVHPI